MKVGFLKENMPDGICKELRIVNVVVGSGWVVSRRAARVICWFSDCGGRHLAGREAGKDW